MQKIITGILLLLPFAVFAQQPPAPDQDKKQKPEHHSIGIGVKFGLNFANVSNASAINSSSQTGFHAGLFLAPDTKSILGSRTELLFSRQGYNYKTGSTDGSVKLDYIMLTQMMAINITKFVQIQLGGHTAYLLNAKADSSQQSTGNPSADKILSFYNRFDYGFGGGVEIHPVMGLIIGARYSISLSQLYKDALSGTNPSFAPSIDLKNNLVTIFTGWRF
jgi:hypothetical protein